MKLKNNLELALINCGFITQYLLYNEFSLKKIYLDKLLEKKILCKNNYMLFGKVTSIYSFSRGSINYLHKEGICIYKHDITQIEHDYILLKVFLSLTLKEQLTWQNETALKKHLGRKVITCDGAYVNNNKIIGVEIFTEDYTKEKISEKFRFLKTYCDSYITFNTIDFERR